MNVRQQQKIESTHLCFYLLYYLWLNTNFVIYIFFNLMMHAYACQHEEHDKYYFCIMSNKFKFSIYRALGYTKIPSVSECVLNCFHDFYYILSLSLSLYAHICVCMEWLQSLRKWWTSIFVHWKVKESYNASSKNLWWFLTFS